MDTHLIGAVSEIPVGERIIVVLRRLRVAGEGESVGVVLPLVLRIVCHLLIEIIGILLQILRIGVRQTILSQDGVHLGVVAARLTEA